MIDNNEPFAVEDKDLSSISALANRQILLEDQIKELEDKIKDLKEHHKQVSNIDIPEALAELGLSEFTLSTGNKVSVKTFYSGNIPKANKDEAFNWLRENGHGDLIKNTVSIDYGKGEDEEAAIMKQHLHNAGQSFTDKTGVHPQTLKAFAREQTESGQTLPLDLLGIFIGQTTKITEG